jgi:hypothetical protein
MKGKGDIRGGVGFMLWLCLQVLDVRPHSRELYDNTPLGYQKKKKKEKSKIKNKKTQPVAPLPMKGRYRFTEKSLRLLLSVHRSAPFFPPTGAD